MTLNEMREVILNDPETKHLVLDDAQVFRVYQYLEMKHAGYEKDGYRPILVTDPYIEIQMQPTKETKLKLEAEKIRENLKFFDSEVYIQKASLEAFDCFNDERKQALIQAQDFLQHYQKNHFYKGLYIHGAYQTGKSYLLSAIAHQLAKKKINVLFCYVPDLVRSIKEGIHEGTLEKRVNLLKQADVLMLDDLGGENLSVWFRDEVLMPVIQYRLHASLPLFISSNFNLKELHGVLSQTKNEDDSVKAMRLIQRIKDLTTFVKLSEERFK